MKLPALKPANSLCFGLLALLAALPWVYAQRPSEPYRAETTTHSEMAPRNEPAARSEPAPRAAPAPRPEAPRAPEARPPFAGVDRSDHGSIRHVDTNVIPRPAAAAPARPNFNVNQHVIVHHDVDVDVNRQRFWHGFVFGERRPALRPGYRQIYVQNQPYFYDDGIYYQQAGEGYQEVYAPVGAVIPELPDGAIEIVAGDTVYYYAGGAFYVLQDGGFVIAPTPIGVTVPELPPGAMQVFVNGGTAYQFNGVYYQPVFVNGVTQFTTFAA